MEPSQQQMEKKLAEAELEEAAQLIAEIEFGGKTAVLRKVYLEITGDLKAAFVLSQIAYWWKTGKNGKSKLRVYRDGRYWLAKRRSDWREEIGLSAREATRAIEMLEMQSLIEVQTYKFAGTPMQHISLNISNLITSFNKVGVPQENGCINPDHLTS